MTKKAKSGAFFRSNAESDERRRLDVIPRVAPIVLVVQALTAAAYAALYVQTGVWQMLAVGALTLLAGGAILMSARERRRGSADSAVYWALASAVIFLPATELFFSGLTYLLAIGSFLLSMGLVGLMPSRRKIGWWVFVGLLGAGLTLFFNWLDPFTPWSRYHTAQSGVLLIFASAIIGVITLIFFWQLIHLYRRANTIRTRLLIASVLMVLLPAIAIGAASTMAGYFNGRDQVISHLGSVAVLKEAEVDTWLNTLQDALPSFITGADAVQRVQVLLTVSSDSADYQEAYRKLSGRFQQNTGQGEQFEE
ncbi:MAG TPA: hypothetical protein G4N96_11595, partial [Chloroflexi bacterium]|nr:hypothetical protein [Chloroflexota bacterium]